MHLVSRQSLAETNRWFRERTLAAVVAGLPEEAIPSSLVQILGEALDRLDVPAHQAGAGERWRSALPFGAPWGKAVIALAAELQFLSSEFRGEYIERSAPFSATIQVALECPEFALAEACLAAALRICARLHCGQTLEMGQEYRNLMDCAFEVCLGGATGPIVTAARRRGIPAYRRDAESLVQLGEGVHQRHVYTAMTSRTSQIAVHISNDKHLVGELWQQIGIPIAASRLVRDTAEAVEAAEEIGWPVAVKPADADYGIGVSLHLRSPEQVRTAYTKARERSARGRVLVQRQLRGASHRLLVVDGRLVAAVRREPLGVRGDGRHSVGELVQQANEDGRWGPERRLTLGESERNLLAEAGFTPETIPALGVQVPLSHDLLAIYHNVTEQVHPDTRDLACDGARVIGLDVGGLDVVALDISRPLAEQEGGFLEINAQPAIVIHGPLHSDRPQPVGEAIVASLFPPPVCGRVPLMVFVGGSEAEEVVLLTAELLRRRGLEVAFSTPEQTLCSGRALHPVSTLPADRLSTMMLHPRTEAAVLRASLADILHFGLGTEQYDVLVLVEGAHGDDEEGMELLDRLIRAARRGVVTLDDPHELAAAAVSALG